MSKQKIDGFLFFRYALPVVNLITRCNGVAALLFHMEHFQGEFWHWRWRAGGGVWVDGRTRESRVVFYPGVGEVEAQWRSTDGEEWSQAALREIGPGVAEFAVTALGDVLLSEGFRLTSVLPGGLVAAFVFGALDLSAGRSVIVAGEAQGCFPDNVLLAAGDFRYVDASLAVENHSPCSGSFVAAEHGAVLTVIEDACSRRFFARSVSPCEWASLNLPSRSL